MTFESVKAEYIPYKRKIGYKGKEYKIGKTKLGYFVTIKLGSKTKRFYMNKKTLPTQISDIVLIPTRGPSKTPTKKGRSIKKVGCNPKSKNANNPNYICNKETNRWNKKKLTKKVGCNPKSKYANNPNYICNKKTNRWNKKKLTKQSSKKIKYESYSDSDDDYYNYYDTDNENAMYNYDDFDEDRYDDKHL